MRPRWDTVAIVGVGMIGGSLGLALRHSKLARKIVGIGRRRSSLQQALRCGAITESTLDLARGVAGAQVVVVCTPVGRIAADVLAAAEHCRPGTLILDAGSTKAEILAAVAGRLPRGVDFVGCHPLAGSEKRGAGAATADLFAQRVVVVTPTDESSAAALRAARSFWRSLGARVVDLSPGEHDELLAATSHVPHVVASLLAAGTPRAALRFVAGGWKDGTRVAAGDAELWRQILAANRGAVLSRLEKFAANLQDFQAALAAEDWPRVVHWLQQGKQIRDAVGS